MVDEKDSSRTPDDEASNLSFHAGSSDPQRIGNYRILRTIGEGGMGIVYEAQQETPIQRKVALKLIKWGMDTHEVIARFESERQALALMNHPHIARVFDAGSTEQGRPYFVMEYVPGIPITTYCDDQRLNTSERLDLFMQVCDAVQHAHQKGIIHRDIKPSNILVTILDNKPVPKIIDFGVAKATQHRLTEKTVFTEFGQIIGTPEYMSPEQADVTALDIDTRSDVYSLGVILYELLAGALPFDLKALRQAGYDEIKRKIKEEEPPKPSTRLSSLGDTSTLVAQKHRTDLAVLLKQLRGDLDWITMKALERDRTRRYASASELVSDIARHINHEPVLARAPSTIYSLRKFIRRHRVGVGAAAIVIVAVIIGLIGTTIGLVKAVRAEAKASQEAETSKQVSEFLVNLFKVSDPSEARGNTITAKEILDKASEKIEKELKDQPLVQARLMGTMGTVYLSLGLYPLSEPLLESALENQMRLLGDDHPDTLTSMNNLAILYRIQGKYDKAEPLYLKALETQKRVLGNDHRGTLTSMNNLALLYTTQGRYADAEPLYLKVLETVQRVLGDNHPDTLKSLNNLAILYRAQGRYAEAEPLYLKALETFQRVLGDDHRSTLTSMNNLANLYHYQGHYDKAEPLYLKILETSRRVLGEDHPDTLKYMNNLASLYRSQGNYQGAEPLYIKTIEIQKRLLGDDHPDTLGSMNNLAVLYRSQGHHDKAEPLHLKILETSRRVSGEDHPDTLKYMKNLAILYQNQGRFDKAEPIYLKTIETSRRVLGDGHQDTLVNVCNLIDMYEEMNKMDKARPLIAEFLPKIKKAAEQPGATARAKNDYARRLLVSEPVGLRDSKTALKFAMDANEIGKNKNADHLATLALAYHLTDQNLKAIETQKKAISLCSEGDPRLKDLKSKLAEFETKSIIKHD